MKKTLFYIAGIMMTLTIIFIICEVFFGIYNPYKLAREWDNREVWEGRTLIGGASMAGDYNVIMLRESNDYTPVRGKYRVLALGDSFTYGWGLRNENSWPKKTEKVLHSEGYDNIEVLNGGVIDSDTDLQRQIFESNSGNCNPDMVIIGFLINDATDLPSNTAAVDLKKKLDMAYRLRKERGRFGTHTLDFLRLSSLKHRLTRATIEEYTYPYENDSETFRECKNAFREFKKLSEKRKFKLIVVIYPLLYQLDKEYPFSGIHERMALFFEKTGIKYYDLTPAFYGQKDTDLWLTNYDAHPNTRANEIAAGRIAEIIKENM